MNPRSQRPWGQDNKLLVKNRAGQWEVLKLPTLPFDPIKVRTRWQQGAVHIHQEQSYADALGAALSLPVRPIRSYIEGGNLFLGTRPEGQPYGLIGRDSVEITAFLLAGGSEATPPDQVQLLIDRHWAQAVEVIAEDLNLASANLGILSQPDFHLDMAIRPLSYPYVLVHDEGLDLPFLDSLLASGRLSGEERSRVSMLRYETRAHQAARKTAGMYAAADQTCRELNQWDPSLIPVRVPGVLGRPKSRRVNFLNAVVHQNLAKPGLVYLTNGCSLPSLNRAFGETLSKALPSGMIRRIEFLAGPRIRARDSDPDDTGETHYLERELTINNGGLHCLSLEIPQ